jgi:hypothetical protein
MSPARLGTQNHCAGELSSKYTPTLSSRIWRIQNIWSVLDLLRPNAHWWSSVISSTNVAVLMGTAWLSCMSLTQLTVICRRGGYSEVETEGSSMWLTSSVVLHGKLIQYYLEDCNWNFLTKVQLVNFAKFGPLHFLKPETLTWKYFHHLVHNTLFLPVQVALYFWRKMPLFRSYEMLSPILFSYSCKYAEKLFTHIILMTLS